MKKIIVQTICLINVLSEDENFEYFTTRKSFAKFCLETKTKKGCWKKPCVGRNHVLEETVLGETMLTKIKTSFYARRVLC